MERNIYLTGRGQLILIYHICFIKNARWFNFHFSVDMFVFLFFRHSINDSELVI